MQRLRSSTMAYVAQANTPETDRQSFVDHVVEGIQTDGRPFAVVVSASDPMDAIEKVATLPDDAFGRLRTAPSLADRARG